MKQLLLFSKTYYSNKAVIEFRKLNILIVFLIFLVIVIATTIPLYMTRIQMNSNDLKDHLPGIDVALKELYELQPNIYINEDGKLEVKEAISLQKVGEYVVKFNEDSKLSEQENAIIFLDQGMVIQYYHTPDEKFSISGSYHYLKGFDFSKIKTDQTELPVEEYYLNVTHSILHSIHYANLSNDYLQLTLFSVVQLLSFIFVISLLLLFANKTFGVNPFTYKESVKMVIIASLSPAIFVALISFIHVTIASLLFTILFTIRIVFLYLNIMRMKYIETQ